MIITVKLFAYFRDDRFKIREMEVRPDTTVGQVVDSLSIDRKEVGVIMTNSRHTEFDAVLQSGDTLAVFPVVGGG